MATGIAWVLNLDADLELGALAAGTRYDRTGPVRRAMLAPIERLALTLLGPDDVQVDDPGESLVTSEPHAAHQVRGRVGRAFCPTPRALGVLARAGAHPEPYPDVDVLRRVNSRAFASALGPTLPGASFVTALDDALAQLSTRPPVGNAWRVKHAFGMAGRNQRVMPLSLAGSGTPAPTGTESRAPAGSQSGAAAVAPRDLAFVRAGLAQGGLQIEPNVAIEEEYAVHAFLPQRGPLRIGAIVRQRCDARGAWLATEPLAAGPATILDLPERLDEECRRVAGALAAAGYFGPFGLDAYSYRDERGELRLQPRSEINARYSMGYPRGLVPPG